MTFGERLQQVIEELDGGNVSAFSRSCGISNSTISSYLDGTNLPKIDKVATIAEKKQISLDWLVLGRGQMRLDGLQDRQRQAEYVAEEGWIDHLNDLSVIDELRSADGSSAGDQTKTFVRMRESGRKVDKALNKIGWRSSRAIEDLFITLTFIYNINDGDLVESLSTIRDVFDARSHS